MSNISNCKLGYNIQDDTDWFMNNGKPQAWFKHWYGENQTGISCHDITTRGTNKVDAVFNIYINNLMLAYFWD